MISLRRKPTAVKPAVPQPTLPEIVAAEINRYRDLDNPVADLLAAHLEDLASEVRILGSPADAATFCDRRDAYRRQAEVERFEREREARNLARENVARWGCC